MKSHSKELKTTVMIKESLLKRAYQSEDKLVVILFSEHLKDNIAEQLLRDGFFRKVRLHGPIAQNCYRLTRKGKIAATKL